ncbi:MAG: (2Fe-2S)-binding protein [bacterium]|nr:(2Fe-2S)-binding protein [bacterium]
MPEPLDGHTSLVLEINGERRAVAFPTHHTLLEVLREECGLTGTKHGCELGECGTCAVLVDGRPVLSCLVLTAEMEGKSIETVEGLADGNELHPLQTALADLNAAQCGYCTPGILMAAKALLAERPHAGRQDIEQALAGNLCRCTGYHKIVEGVEWAASRMRGEDAVAPQHVLYGEPEPGSAAKKRSHGSPPSPKPNLPLRARETHDG